MLVEFLGRLRSWVFSPCVLRVRTSAYRCLESKPLSFCFGWLVLATLAVFSMSIPFTAEVQAQESFATNQCQGFELPNRHGECRCKRSSRKFGKSLCASQGLPFDRATCDCAEEACRGFNRIRNGRCRCTAAARRDGRKTCAEQGLDFDRKSCDCIEKEPEILAQGCVGPDDGVFGFERALCCIPSVGRYRGGSGPECEAIPGSYEHLSPLQTLAEQTGPGFGKNVDIRIDPLPSIFEVEQYNIYRAVHYPRSGWAPYALIATVETLAIADSDTDEFIEEGSYKLVTFGGLDDELPQQVEYISRYVYYSDQTIDPQANSAAYAVLGIDSTGDVSCKLWRRHKRRTCPSTVCSCRPNSCTA